MKKINSVEKAIEEMQRMQEHERRYIGKTFLVTILMFGIGVFYITRILGGYGIIDNEGIVQSSILIASALIPIIFAVIFDPEHRLFKNFSVGLPGFLIGTFITVITLEAANNKNILDLIENGNKTSVVISFSQENNSVSVKITRISLNNGDSIVKTINVKCSEFSQEIKNSECFKRVEGTKLDELERRSNISNI